MKQVDIALFAPSLRGGGAERVMVNLARGFVEQGLRVDLVLAKAEGPYISYVHPKARIIDLSSSRVLYSLPKLIKYLRSVRPKVMLSTATHANIVALWASKMANTSTRVGVREVNTPSINIAHASTLRGRWMSFLMKRFYPWADVIIANSLSSARDLAQIIQIPIEQIKVIYNPVITPEFFSKAEEPVEHFWFRGRMPVVLGVGRLTEQKDFPTLIRAFAIARQIAPFLKLIILGEGETRPQLEMLIRELKIQNDALLPGFVSNPYPYIKRATVFVLSSRWEGLPNALIEALALGTPVVSTDCPSGPREILEDGRWGTLVPVGDVERMAEAILEALNKPKPQQVPKEVLARFKLSSIVQQYLEVLL